MNRKILIIDDDQNILKTIKYSLNTIKSALQEVITLDLASNIKQAEYFLNNNVYDLVITDYVINGVPVDDLLKLIKNSGSQNYKVMTAIRDISKLRELLDSGVSQIIYKPFHWHELIENMSETISLKQTIQ